MARTTRLVVVLSLNLALVAALVLVGIAAHSLAVLAEGGDYLLDAAGVAVALFAIRLSARASRRPGGRPYPHAGMWAALINAGWLLALELLVVAGAIDRLVAGVPVVRGLPVLIVSAVAAVVMTAGALMLGGERDEADDADDTEDGEEHGHRLSVQAIFLDTAGDAAAAAGVAVAGAIIWVARGIYWIDPAVALAIATVISWQATRLLLRVRAQLIAARSSLQNAGSSAREHPVLLVSGLHCCEQ
jgi:cobalt-zinc-cadmium efflux system protein